MEMTEFAVYKPGMFDLPLTLLQFPSIDPIAFSIPIPYVAELPVRWYALAYIFGLIGAWRYGMWIAARPDSVVTPEQVDGFLTWAIAGVVLGGRLGYVLFYNLPYYVENPGQILAAWRGGMAFHGGLAGVVIAGFLYTAKNKIARWTLADIAFAAAPIGLFLGRIANFVNGELWGRTTDVSWAMVFPNAGDLPRHPSQLYEAALEGLLLFIILFLLVRRGALARPGLITGVFVAGYGLSRYLVEFVREPDPHLGLMYDFVSRGQLLSLPMIVLGLWFIWRARRQSATT